MTGSLTHTPEQYERLYHVAREALAIHHIGTEALKCAQLIPEYSFKLCRPAAFIPLPLFAQRTGLDKSHCRRALVWIDLVGIARCYTDRGVYFFKPDYRQWDHHRVRLWWDPSAWHPIHEPLLLIPPDPTLDDALAAVSRDAVLDFLTSTADGVSAVAGDGASPAGVSGGGGTPLSGVAGPATPPVAGLATDFVNNSRRAGCSSSQPAAGAAVGAVANPATPPVAGLATLSPPQTPLYPENYPVPGTRAGSTGVLTRVRVANPATAAEERDRERYALGQVAELCGAAELRLNGGLWRETYRDGPGLFLQALGDTKLQRDSGGFTVNAAAYLRNRIKDLRKRAKDQRKGRCPPALRPKAG